METLSTEQALLMETETNDRKRKRYLIGLISFIVLLIALGIFWIVYYVEVIDSKDTETRICRNADCIAISDELSFYMNKSANPCSNFYNYACGGWQERQKSELSKSRAWGNTIVSSNQSQYTTQMNMARERDDDVLSILYSTNDQYEELNQHSCIQSMRTFYESCMVSTVDEEDIESNQLLNEMMNMMTFSTNFTNINDINKTWTSDDIEGFQNALSWLFKRRWNLFYYLDVYSQQKPLFMQNYEIWVNYNHSQWNILMDDTFISLYQSLFSLSLNDSILISKLVLDFMNATYSITTANSSYFSSTSRSNYEDEQQLTEISEFLGDSEILNYTQLIIKTFDIDTNINVYDLVNSFIYLRPGTSYFNALINLIENTSPIVIQYFLFTNIMYYYLDYQQSFTQNNRLIDRKEYCINLIRTNYGYAFSHILYVKLYSNEKHEKAMLMVDYIKTYGLTPLIENADWIDDESKQEALKKVNFMRFFIGLPDGTKNITLLDIYYEKLIRNINSSSNHGFVTNYNYIFDFNMNIRLQRFYYPTTEIDIISPWPSYFAQQGREYLTSAFYNRAGNWFCVFHVILNPPYFNVIYPSYLNFGAVGFIMGHEFSHGFDKNGVQNNFNGSVNRIFTNQTMEIYNEKTQCFVDQYDNMTVNDFYLNGTNSITENVADSAGVQETHLSWLQFINDYNQDINERIIGFEELNGYQLYWLAFARTRCDVWTDDFYRQAINQRNGYYWTHSPGIARITGVIHNTKAFSDAWNCPLGSTMNPQQKCILW